jgi:hypothetical protein
MMFMIPMPPTISDTAAMLPSSAVIVFVARSSVRPSCSSVTFSRPPTLPTTARATSGRIPPRASDWRAWVETVKSSGSFMPMPCRVRSSSVTSFDTRDTSPVDAAVIVMSFSFDRFNSLWIVVNGT